MILLSWTAAAAAAAVKSLESCLTLCEPIDRSPPGSPVPGILGKNTGVGCHFLIQCMKVKVKVKLLSGNSNCDGLGLRMNVACLRY